MSSLAESDMYSQDQVDTQSDSESFSDAEPADHYKQQLSQVSFGALAKAQKALGDSSQRKRKRGQDTNGEQEAKLLAVRERLKEIRELNEGAAVRSQNPSTTIKDATSTRRGESDSEFDSAGSGSDSEERDPATGEKKKKRSSKHAPTAMPANRAVGRHREVVPIHKIKSRDPRFDVTSGKLDYNAVNARYSFIDGYQADELTSIRKALKDPKAKLTEQQRETLKRKAVSLESKIAAAKAKQREDKVRQEHRRNERQAVAEGKTPYYLKKSEVRKQALVDRFESMKSRQKDKVIQRRRKKLAAKERRNMPMDRRM